MRKSKGQTLIEVLAAFGIAVVLVSAIVIAVLTALSNAQFSRNQNLATQYAQEGMEVMRQKHNAGELFDSNPQCLVLEGTEFTLMSESQQSGQKCPTLAEDKPFVRRVTISNNSSSCGGQAPQEVILKVFWSDNKCKDPNNQYCHNVELISCLSDFNRVQAP